MSRWGGGVWYPRTPKRPPPAHGIKLQRAGSTWWGQRWIEALQAMSGGYSNRLARGRTYARAGRTHDLVVQAGQVTARVTGSRPTPYTVTISLKKLSDAAWTTAIRAMAEQAQFAAELLAGQMPQAIDDAFRTAGASLFPVKVADLTTACSCPDWANPCKHVAATHYVLGEALDRDPFLLFELRGRSKDEVRAALRAARGRAAEPAARTAATDREIVIPTVTLSQLGAAAYDAPAGALPALHLTFEALGAGGAVLRQLGPLRGWSSEAAPVDMLEPLVCAAAERARVLALAEPEVGGGDSTAEDPPVPVPQRTRRGTPRKPRPR